MSYQILEVNIYPKNKKFKRITIPFFPGSLNVIHGASKTGKTALIKIINYCLCSGSCDVPAGIIRDCVDCYSVTLVWGEKKIFLARKAPSGLGSSGKMDFYYGENLITPEEIFPKLDVEYVKGKLNELFGHSTESFINNDPKNKRFHPTFRTGVKMVIQGQNILADNDRLLDGFEDTNDFVSSLQFQDSVGLLSSEHVRIESEYLKLKKDKSTLEERKRQFEQDKASFGSSLLGWANKCVEYGFLNDGDLESKSGESLFALLKKIVGNKDTYLTSSNYINGQIKKKTELKQQLDEKNSALLSIKTKLEGVARICSKKDDSLSSFKTSVERIEISKWLSDLISNNKDDDFFGYDFSKDAICELVEATKQFEEEINKTSEYFQNLEREKTKYEREIEQLSSDIINLQKELDISVERFNGKENGYTLSDKLLFLGKLDSFLEKSPAISKDNYSEKIASLDKRIEELDRKRASEDSLEQNKKMMEQIITKYALEMGAEYSQNDVLFNLRNLGLYIRVGDEYISLSKIGSGANILSYHLATVLGILEYKNMCDPNSKLPSFAVFDQPSQCFFDSEEQDADQELGEGDKAILKKCYKAMRDFVNKTFNQVIVIEHADKTIWGEDAKEVIYKSEDGDKLIPQSWANDIDN